MTTDHSQYVPYTEPVCGHVGRIVVTPQGRDPQYSYVKPAGHRPADDDRRRPRDEWHEDSHGNQWNYDV